MSRARVVIVLVLVATVAFSIYLGYVAWSSSSFPTKEEPFASYATVTATKFNGTELYFRVQWNASGSYLPLYAQITSDQTDEANSPVCDLGVASATRGQTFDLPFTITAPKEALASVDLSIAVGVGSKAPVFTIVYHIDQIEAQPGNISPTEYSCSQPASNL